MNLPDDQSLTSAFAGLGFTDGMTVGAGGPLPESKSLENCSMFLGGHYLNVLEKPNSNLDPQMRVVPENFSANAPFANAVQGFQFLSNVPVPAMPDQEQFFPGAQSVLPYSHSHQLNPPPTSWSNVEEEQYYRMHQQYLYLQQFPIQRFEAQHPIQAQGNVTTRLMSENLRQPYFEVPISNQLVKSRQESFWTNYRGSNQPHPALSFTESDAMPGLVKVAKHKFPERILTRSQGMNTLKTVKFGSVDGKESVDHVTQNGEVPSHCQLWDTISTPRTVDFQLDSLNSWGFPLKLLILKVFIMGSLPQAKKYNSVNEVAGRVYLMAKDQHGCRFLQRKLAEGAPTDVEKIFVEIVDYIVDLMTDPFGNYLVQKLLEICDEDQQMQILHAITRQSGELVRISCNMHGTRAVQKVIETLKTPEQFSMIVSSLKPGIVTLMKNVNGNHVAQRCLQKLVPEYSEFLFEAATANCIDLATDRHGCCVLQKCLGHSDGEPRRRLVCKITSHALLLSQDPYALNILGQLEGNYGDLSMQKFSSNVVEKCLRHAGEERQSHIIQELIDDPRLDQIMQDPYGNYVIQAALNQSKGAFHTALVAAIRQHDPVLQTSPYGKKVLSSCGLKNKSWV
ncbi:hypothetical protein CJ030_MR1G006860 [Morella rubra]|uniref:PUM-HD domain-containing protein n=1 Tax=Morella rubra TaxID=262757 RepID=A0A6A1WTL7_9ROSI|nr:hypothetical protein CJ030_MR1G006860 [Morella rubra]